MTRKLARRRSGLARPNPIGWSWPLIGGLLGAAAGAIYTAVGPRNPLYKPNAADYQGTALAGAGVGFAAGGISGAVAGKGVGTAVVGVIGGVVGFAAGLATASSNIT